MTAYSVILFVIAAAFVLLGVLIFRGNTKLIHDYHQTKVSEEKKSAYAREFSVGVFLCAAGMILSGVIALFGESRGIMIASVVALFAGIIAGTVVFGIVQKKYNGGLF